MQKREAEKLAGLGSRRIPADFDYSKVDGLSREIRDKLTRIRPADLGMAGRIPGVTPAAVTILNVQLELRRSKRRSAEERAGESSSDQAEGGRQ
jgi:tRNA uridine 5-carboxymethylaminomethyl modification enzyme